MHGRMVDCIIALTVQSDDVHYVLFHSTMHCFKGSVQGMHYNMCVFGSPLSSCRRAAMLLLDTLREKLDAARDGPPGSQEIDPINATVVMKEMCNVVSMTCHERESDPVQARASTEAAFGNLREVYDQLTAAVSASPEVTTCVQLVDKVRQIHGWGSYWRCFVLGVGNCSP